MDISKRYMFSTGARELWANVYPDLTEARSGNSGAMVGRAEAYVVRLALNYCLFRGGNQIEVEDLKAALALWRYADQSVSYIFSGAAVPDRKKQKILECIAGGERTTTEIRREAFSGHIDSSELKVLLDDLVGNEVLIAEQIKTGGAPKTIYKKKSSVKSELSFLDLSTGNPETPNTHKTQGALLQGDRVCPPPPPPVFLEASSEGGEE